MMDEHVCFLLRLGAVHTTSVRRRQACINAGEGVAAKRLLPWGEPGPIPKKWR